VSIDDQFRDPEVIESSATDAPGARGAGGAGSGASDGSLAELREIEDMPLAERAPAYQALADRLRAELEQSDPSRGSN
jgi:hypothetical protein